MPRTSVYFDKLLADLRLSKYKLYELVVCSDSDEDFPDNPDFTRHEFLSDEIF